MLSNQTWMTLSCMCILCLWGKPLRKFSNLNFWIGWKFREIAPLPVKDIFVSWLLESWLKYSKSSMHGWSHDSTGPCSLQDEQKSNTSVSCTQLHPKSGNATRVMIKYKHLFTTTIKHSKILWVKQIIKRVCFDLLIQWIAIRHFELLRVRWLFPILEACN